MRWGSKEAKSKSALHFFSPQLFKIFFLVSVLTLSLQPGGLLSQDQPKSSSENKTTASRTTQSSSILNPNISVIGWFQGALGNSPREPEKSTGFQFREIELAFQSAVDPYFLADVFVAVDHKGEVDLEEGYLTTLALPYRFQAKFGKFLPEIGRFNRTHPPETPFADQPSSVQRFFGDEPFKVIGVGTSYLLPNPWEIYLNLDTQVGNLSESKDLFAFAQADRQDLLYLAKISAFEDLTESTNLSLGVSYANGPNGFEVSQVDGSSTTRRNDLVALDFIFRWKNPRRAIDRSLLWQTEFYWTKRDVAPQPPQKRGGAFSYLNYQFARRWHFGVRADWVQSLDSNGDPETGGLLYLTFMPSEFSLVSLQGKHLRLTDGRVEDIGFLKMTFNIGPHGKHPF